MNRIPTSRIAFCHFCSEAIDAEAPTTYRQVSGWARNRTAGGTNALALRRPFDSWACRLCVDRLSSGVAAEQGTLL